MTNELPAAYSEERLRANLVALERTAPELARRLALPCGSEHVRFDAQGRAAYRLHRSVLPLSIDAEPARERAAAIGRAGSATLFGLGLGELAEAMLAAAPAARIAAWERDPWLVRLFLMRADVRAPLSDGRLALYLGIDLLGLVPQREGVPWIEHPLLARVYPRERWLFARGVGAKRAALVEGGLFVGALGRGLTARGWSVYTADVRRLAREELALCFQRLRPGIAVAVNYVHGLAEFCREQGVPLVCWEIDPAVDRPRPCRVPTDAAHVFTYRRANVEHFLGAGFTRVQYLPLAADVDERRPVALGAPELDRYRAPIAFVGSSMAAEGQAHRARFERRYAAWRGGDADAEREARELAGSVLARQRADFTRYQVPELLEAACPEFLAAERARDGDVDPVLLLAETAAAEKRLSYAALLGPLGLQTWGDPGWKAIERAGASYRGFAGHERELALVYSGAAINLDVGRLYQNDIVPMRVFDVLACGGFALVEHSEALAELFAVGRELESYRGPAEMVEKARWFLAHPERAREIAERGRAAVLARHAVGARLDHMLAAAGVGPG